MRNRHFCFLLLFVCLFVCLFFVITKHYLRSIFLLHFLLFVILGAPSAFLWKVRPLLPGS